MCGATKQQEARDISQYAYVPIIVNPHIPQVGKGWGFVAICQHVLPQGWGICPRIFIVFKTPIQNVEDLQHKIVPRGGEFVKRLLQIPNNPHPCPTWGR